MMMDLPKGQPMVNCPTDDTLRSYLEDTLPPDCAGDLTGHIDQCPTCQTRLGELTEDSGVVSRIRFVTGNKPERDTADDLSEPINPTIMMANGVVVSTIPAIVGGTRLSIPGYMVLEEIGRGGMGVVYKAIHKRLNRTAAVKMVLAGGLADPRVTQRFLFEAEVLGRVRHPQVVQVYEVSMYNAPTGVTIPYLSMEYLDGGTLGQWSDGKPQVPKVAAELVQGLARAVHTAHLQGIIHRDLKPANILRGSDGLFKITDFGLAKLTAESSGGLTGTGTVVGTPAYMAPEQASGEKGIGPTADVYSLGAILFELLAGRPPFVGQEPMSVILKVIREQPPELRSIRSDIPRELSAVVSKCLTKEPHRRYSSAEVLADDLNRFLQGRPIQARQHGTAERLWYWSRRNPSMAFVLGTLIVVFIAGLLSILSLWHQAITNASAMRAARDSAQRQYEEANTQRDEAAKQRKEADRQGAYLAFDQAKSLCENGQLDEGIRAFVRALELAERTGDSKLARVIRINLAAWDKELLPSGTRFQFSENIPILDCGFSPDGKWVYAAGADSRILIWEADTGNRVVELSDGGVNELQNLLNRSALTKGLADPPSIRAVAINKDRTRIAACLSSGGILIWSPNDSKPRFTFSARQGANSGGDLWTAEFDSEGQLWVGGDGALLARYDVETGKVTKNLILHDPSVTKNQGLDSVQILKLSESGKTLYSGPRSGEIRKWDIETEKTIMTDPIGGWVDDVAINGSETLLAAASTKEAHIVLIANNSVQQKWTIPTYGAYAKTIQMTADGRWIILGDEDGKARIWDVATRNPIGGPLQVGLFAKRIKIRPGREELLIPNKYSISLQPLNRKEMVPLIRDEHNHRIRSLHFAQSGHVLVGGFDQYVCDSQSGNVIDKVLSRNGGYLTSRFFDQDRRILTGDRMKICVFAKNAREFEQIGELSSNGYVYLIPQQPDTDSPWIFMSHGFKKISPHGRQFLETCMPDGLNLKRTAPTAADITPNGNEIRIAIMDTIHFHNLKTGKKTRAPIQLADEIRAMTTTADGQWLIAGLRDNTIEMRDVKTGAARYTVPPSHQLAVTSVAISPDSKTLFTGSRDETARYWDAETGLALGPKLRHADAVMAVAISPQGQRAVTGTSGGLALSWPMPPEPIEGDIPTLQARYEALTGNARPPAATFK